MSFDVIFIAGPQGSGKGTQGKKLADKLGFFFWGMGGILREIQNEQSPLHEKLAGADRGTLLPDDVIIEIVKDRFAKVPQGQGVVFDGVPRRIGQAEFLIPFLRDRGHHQFATVFLDLPREESLKRLVLRAQHEERVDDTPEAILRRFAFYDEEMPPLIEYLKRETQYFDIDGTPAVEAIERNIENVLGLVPKP